MISRTPIDTYIVTRDDAVVDTSAYRAAAVNFASGQAALAPEAVFRVIRGSRILVQYENGERTYVRQDD